MRVRAVVMFGAGAVVGYWLVAYYGELLWVGDANTSLVVSFIVAPAGALVCGVISAVFARRVAVFAATTVIGYLVVTAGWFVFADAFGIGDREGSKGMGMIFIFGPAGGAMIEPHARRLSTKRRCRQPSEPALMRSGCCAIFAEMRCWRCGPATGLPRPGRSS
jgi:hypothetical protein